MNKLCFDYSWIRFDWNFIGQTSCLDSFINDRRGQPAANYRLDSKWKMKDFATWLWCEFSCLIQAKLNRRNVGWKWRELTGRLWWAVPIIDTLVNSDKGIQISIAVQSSILCLQLDTFQIIDTFIFSYMQPWCFMVCLSMWNLNFKCPFGHRGHLNLGFVQLN